MIEISLFVWRKQTNKETTRYKQIDLFITFIYREGAPPVARFCTTKPIKAIIARRPLFNSFTLIVFNASFEVGLKPNGSKPRSPKIEYYYRFIYYNVLTRFNYIVNHLEYS